MVLPRRLGSSVPPFGALLLAIGSAMCSPTRAPSGFDPPSSATRSAAKRAAELETGSIDAAWGAAETAIDAAVKQAIDDELVPGAVVVVGRRDRVLMRRAYGFRELQPERAPMTLDTLFDLASVTKPMATATALMVLVEKGAIALDDPLVKYVPECDGAGRAAITLRHLLLHVSGLPADTPKEDFAHGREEALRRICKVALRAPPGAASIYSDLGFILLEEVVRRVASAELPDFARANVFAPLGMNDTGYLPSEARRARAAWTELVDGEWRVGVVHDPRAYLLGGVAGHAGLFATADDVAIYARAVLGGGAYEGRRVLSPATVAAMIAPHDVPGGVRALGWAVESQWRGDGLSPRAIGHFGFTGTALWIDPDRDLFTVVLTNRVHPDGKGDSKPLVAQVNTITARWADPNAVRVARCESLVAGPGVGSSDGVRPGIDVLREQHFAALRGAHVGLITNASGRARDGASTIDVLKQAPGVSLVALFAPEHGLDADRQGPIEDGRDERTGLPVYSLYGDSFAPTPESLAGVDTLVFDMQDAGTRFYTYPATMRRAMHVARDRGLRFVVLDRPNPIDGVDLAGPVLAPGTTSLVNDHPLPVRHGMTLGELATMFNADEHLGLALTIVPTTGWRRAAYADETGLPWVNPSPNLRNVNEALLYPSLGLLEATNLSVGRGTDAPFERLGAPWIDGKALAAALVADALPGVAFAAESFTPTSDRYAGQTCEGVHVTVLDRDAFAPVRTGLAMARELRRLYPQAWSFQKLDRLLVHAAAMRAIDAGLPVGAIVETYRGDLAAFAAKREKYLLYGRAGCGPTSRIESD
jgi:uncharacterized protein YbbC (DUF1343 family)/CubicO group peptidase (beta-lactamase class C family)